MKKIPGIPKHWQYFLLCILFSLLLPLLPIGIEFWRFGKLDEKSLTLVASVYSVGIGVKSKNMLLFGTTVFICIIDAFAYGIMIGQESILPKSGEIAFVTIVVIFILHAGERYNRHIIDKAPFFEFLEARVD